MALWGKGPFLFPASTSEHCRRLGEGLKSAFEIPIPTARMARPGPTSQRTRMHKNIWMRAKCWKPEKKKKKALKQKALGPPSAQFVVKKGPGRLECNTLTPLHGANNSGAHSLAKIQQCERN